MGRRGTGRAGPVRADHDPPPGGLDRAGPAALVDHGRHRLRRGPGAGARGLRRGRRGGLLGRPADLRARDRGRATRSARASCGRTTGPPPRPARWPSAWGATTSTGPAPASRSMPVPWRPSWPGWPSTSPSAWRPRDVILSPARLHRLPHDRPAGDRRHLRLAQRPLRLRRQRRARAGRAGAGQAPERRAVRHGGRPAQAGAGRRARAAARASRSSSAPATASARSWARAPPRTARW